MGENLGNMVHTDGPCEWSAEQKQRWFCLEEIMLKERKSYLFSEVAQIILFIFVFSVLFSSFFQTADAFSLRFR